MLAILVLQNIQFWQATSGMRKKLLTRIYFAGQQVPCFLKMEQNCLSLFGNLFFLAFLLSVDCLCLTVPSSSELSKKGWSDKKRSRYRTTVPNITMPSAMYIVQPLKAPSSTSFHVKVIDIDFSRSASEQAAELDDERTVRALTR